MNFGDVISPPLFFLCQDYFGNSKSLALRAHFSVGLPVSYLKPARILIGIILNLQIGWGEWRDNFKILSLLVHEHGLALHLFRSPISPTLFYSVQHRGLAHFLLDLFLGIWYSFLFYFKWYFLFSHFSCLSLVHRNTLLFIIDCVSVDLLNHLY